MKVDLEKLGRLTDTLLAYGPAKKTIGNRKPPAKKRGKQGKKKSAKRLER